MKFFPHKKKESFIKKIIKSERGQSMVEFAIVLPILLMLVLIPVDYYRYISAQMELNQAVVDGLNYLQYEDIESGDCQGQMLYAINVQYGKNIDITKLVFDKLDISAKEKEEYTYYVYSSDKSTEAIYQDRFDSRPSSYEHCNVTAQLSYSFEPVTFWGELLMGETKDVTSKEVSRDIYAGGYVPGP